MPRHAAQLTLEHTLLALLDQKPMHGYELHQELSGRKGISQVWNIKQALLYAIMDKLEERGFVSSRLVQGESYPPRKYFHLTIAGKRSLQEWLRTPVRRARDLRQEFLAKLIVARQYGPAEVNGLLAAQQRACQAWLEELQAEVLMKDQEHMDEWVVHSFRLNRVQAVLEWLQMLQRELNQAGANESHPAGSR